MDKSAECDPEPPFSQSNCPTSASSTILQKFCTTFEFADPRKIPLGAMQRFLLLTHLSCFGSNASCENDKYVVSLCEAITHGATMTDASELQKRLEGLKREYRGARSLIEMMEKSTPQEELQKIRAEKMKPLEEEIRKLELKISE